MHGTPDNLTVFVAEGESFVGWYCDLHDQIHEFPESEVPEDPRWVGLDKWATRFAVVVFFIGLIYVTAHILVAAGVACPTK